MKKHHGALAFSIAVVSFVTGALFHALIASPQPQPTPVPTSAAEVSDLIARLRPLSKSPDGEWYSSGIEINFYGKGVRMTLKMPNGNEYHARATTLREAVARLTEPSKDIQEALRGWPQ